MLERLPPENPIAQGVVLIVACLLISMYFLYLTPVAALFLTYQGLSWYRPQDETMETAGLLLLVSAVVFLGLSVVVYAGLLREPSFAMGNAAVGTLLPVIVE